MINPIKNAFAALLLCIYLGPALAQQATDKDDSILIRGGWLFDGVSESRRRNTGILVKRGKIVAVDVKSASDGKVIEMASSDTIIPGMFDLHAHYNFDFIDKGRVEEVAYNGIIFLANGVTSTWSAGEFYPERVIAQRERIESGESIGPRLFVSGPYFGAFRCEYKVKVAKDDCIAWPNDITEEEIRAEVDKWASQGVLSLKIKQATSAEMQIILEQAHKHGMTATGHLANYNVEYDVSTKDAILMGIDRIEHQLTLGSGGPKSAELPEIIDLMIKHQVYYDANLQMYGGILERQKHIKEMIWTDESRYFTAHAQHLLKMRGPPPPESEEIEFRQRVLELKTLYHAGGANLLVVGTDEPVYTSLLPGFAYHRELLAMVYAGLPPIAVLKAATLNGAKALGVDEQLGSIEAGKKADMVVVKGNPLEDIKIARDIRFVLKEGIIYEPDKLLQSAEGKIGPKDADDYANWQLHVTPLRSSPNN